MDIQRQYIGARYVPKFFDNNGSAEWLAGFPYEPLTIVTRLGNSYTSKVPVPVNVGAPETNPHYWVNTGNYNEQLERYREELEKIEKETSQGNYIIIADSYGDERTVNNPWTSVFKRLLKLDNTNSITLAESGSGFTATIKWIDMISNANIPFTKDSVKNIIVCGGANDCQTNYDSIINAIQAFMNYVKINFKNAKVSLGHISGWKGVGDSVTYKLYAMKNSIPAYTSINRYGGFYLSGVENILFNNSLISDDNLHPNENGGNYLGSGIAESFINGYCNVFYPIEIATTDKGSFTESNLYLEINVVNDITNVKYNLPLEMTLTTPEQVSPTKENIWYLTGDIMSNLWNTFPGIITLITMELIDNEGVIHNAIGTIEVRNNKNVWLRCNNISGETFTCTKIRFKYPPNTLIAYGLFMSR